MFPFVVDHRHTLEPSLQIYRASRSAFKAASRGQRPRDNEAPPAYTPTATYQPTRKPTSASTATFSSSTSTSSSISSGSSTTSKRSRLARLNPFHHLRHHKSSSSSPISSPPTSTPSLTPTSTSTSTSPSPATFTTAPRHRRPQNHQQNRVRFADQQYDSDASSIYSTDFPPEEQEHRSRGQRQGTKSTPSAAMMPYTRGVDENSTYPAFLYIF
ncbi:uncharacterized protein HMPREF1541_01126 [Cyphellophora europaea CBS 101466]|uniref:Uncharacterized protein n=1 Tax=Cyphellophora europaea (strain CBS 101466) TaxID=1220924 RepID=W2SE30_CYPE1|nr:uncharacterized protein HMPREF1541_01126 [Cyphellophora europaea CBS 101466]ETN46937.1 hypothetical protein HMPREF1541_01126 [Cyphellophora europaea CBS 101466]